MRRALELAARGLGLAPPNPMVGALVASDGEVVGEGWHEGPGTAHAEIRAVRAAGDRARGATLYVTLEPCSHQGRTPPCAPVVAGSGVSRVVVGTRDPNPVVDGRGLAHLRAEGLDVAEGICGEEARDLVAGFSKHVTTGLPFVRLKLAMSLDGKVAARDGSSRWITGEAARRDAHRLRAAAGAIVVGVGTVVSDDPALTVRLDGYRGRQPLRVVLDGNGRTPPDAAVLGRDAPTLVFTTASAPSERRTAWESAGAEVLVEGGAAGSSHLDLARVAELLGARDVQEVLIEGGPTIAWSALEGGLVDRLVVYVAPKLIGGVGAPSALGGSGIASIADAFPISIVSVERLEEDLKVVADVHRDR
jgi:diaminohydroxyphosphoribosylaminopyrimidine deaminase/5-amino-6-(5-phosphoribosylamino)uracil reductase